LNDDVQLLVKAYEDVKKGSRSLLQVQSALRSALRSTASNATSAPAISVPTATTVPTPEKASPLLDLEGNSPAAREVQSNIVNTSNTNSKIPDRRPSNEHTSTASSNAQPRLSINLKKPAAAASYTASTSKSGNSNKTEVPVAVAVAVPVPTLSNEDPFATSDIDAIFGNSSSSTNTTTNITKPVNDLDLLFGAMPMPSTATNNVIAPAVNVAQPMFTPNMPPMAPMQPMQPFQPPMQPMQTQMPSVGPQMQTMQPVSMIPMQSRMMPMQTGYPSMNPMPTVNGMPNMPMIPTPVHNNPQPYPTSTFPTLPPPPVAMAQTSALDNNPFGPAPTPLIPAAIPTQQHNTQADPNNPFDLF
jgi:hypothetical protein